MHIERTVRDFLRTSFYLPRDRELPGAASLLESGIVDSTGVLELIGFLEKTFGIRVADDEILPENLDSVDRITSFVDRKLHERAAE